MDDYLSTAYGLYQKRTMFPGEYNGSFSFTGNGSTKGSLGKSNQMMTGDFNYLIIDEDEEETDEKKAAFVQQQQPQPAPSYQSNFNIYHYRPQPQYGSNQQLQYGKQLQAPFNGAPERQFAGMSPVGGSMPFYPVQNPMNYYSLTAYNKGTSL